MTYEMVVLAALIQLKPATVKAIVTATGISERKVQAVIKTLENDFDIGIIRMSAENKTFYSIESWGVFETGKKISTQLLSLNLDAYKASRVSSKIIRKRAKSASLKNQEITKPTAQVIKTPSPRLATMSEKINHFEKIKLSHYRDSLRLEGIESKNQTVPKSKNQREKLKQELIKKHTVKVR